jgi:hypothetical protein
MAPIRTYILPLLPGLLAGTWTGIGFGAHRTGPDLTA